MSEKTAYFLKAEARKTTLQIVSACNVSSSGHYFVEIKYWRTGRKGANTRTFCLNENMFMWQGSEPGWWSGAPAYLVAAAKKLVADSIRAGLPFFEYNREGGKRVTRYPSQNEEMRYYTDEFIEHWLKRVEAVKNPFSSIKDDIHALLDRMAGDNELTEVEALRIINALDLAAAAIDYGFALFENKGRLPGADPHGYIAEKRRALQHYSDLALKR